ncbi:MAG: C40 family peptidase [Candidatus Omnitrophica bacterium]|nr:C40 family peptidase [Candidatus Omnitrophota bacterium]
MIRRAARGALLALMTGCAMARPMLVGVPLTDLRAHPRTVAQPSVHDPEEETQLFYGEPVRVLEEHNGWVRVEAMEQAEFSHATRWQGYPGWLPKSDLMAAHDQQPPSIVVADPWVAAWTNAYLTDAASLQFPMGTLLSAIEIGHQVWRIELPDGEFVWIPHGAARPLEQVAALPHAEKRRMILHSAQRLIGEPYYWGGRAARSNARANRAAGFDCSGVVNVAYRTVGLAIPRDAHEQFLRAKKISTLQPADLIFLSAPNDPSRIVHVMLYAGDGDLIEAPQTGNTVRRISLRERLGRTIDQLTPGTVIDGQTVFFGSYLPA